MPDITKCNGGSCSLKDSCYRYTSPQSKRQSYFMELPYDSEKKECKYYWKDEDVKDVGILHK